MTEPQPQLPIDMFTTVHKGLRWWMGRLGASLGAATYTDADAQAVLTEVEEFLAALDAHSLHEELFIVPLLTLATDRAAAWRDDHHRLEALEGAMRRQIEGVRRLDPKNPSAAALGLALYRTFYRLAAEILRHLDEEEALLMPLLRTVLDEAELRRLVEDFQSQFGKEAMRLHARVAPAYNPVERARLGV